jgi:hypothetical protein
MPIYSGSQIFQKFEAVPCTFENVTLLITSRGNMVESSRKVDTGKSIRSGLAMASLLCMRSYTFIHGKFKL